LISTNFFGRNKKVIAISQIKRIYTTFPRYSLGGIVVADDKVRILLAGSILKREYSHKLVRELCRRNPSIKLEEYLDVYIKTTSKI